MSQQVVTIDAAALPSVAGGAATYQQYCAESAAEKRESKYRTSLPKDSDVWGYHLGATTMAAAEQAIAIATPYAAGFEAKCNDAGALAESRGYHFPASLPLLRAVKP